MSTLNKNEVSRTDQHSKGPVWREEEVKALIDEVFQYFRRPIIYEHEFFSFLARRKGMVEEEIKELLVYAHTFGVINMGAEPTSDGKVVVAIWRPEDLGEPPWQDVVKALEEFYGRTPEKRRIKGSKKAQL